MKIKQIDIQGFRGFREKITIDLHPNVTVFVGVNGSGKSSVLDAIAKLLEVFEKEIPYTLGNVDSLLDNDINNFEKQCTLEITLVEKVSWKLIKEKDKEIRLAAIDEICEFKDFVSSYFNQDVKFYLPVLVYYSINRNLNNIIADKLDPSELDAELPHILDWLDKSYNAFCEFEGWFIIAEHKIRLAKEKGWDESFHSKELGTVKKAFKIFNKEFFDSAYRGFFYIKKVDEYKYGSRLFIKKDKREIRLDSLSDGEANIILLVCDIARRLAENKSGIKGKGIVLVDEIELHLHPGWQRKLVSALTKVFPNIQFILTTHSPQVLSNLKEENIRVIENFKLVEGINPVYGEDSNDILWNIFGVKKRPIHAEEKFSNFYRLLETDQEKAKVALNDLEAVYGTEHTEVKKAQMDYDLGNEIP